MSPNSNELSMLVVRNYVLKARDLVIAELLGTRGRNGASDGRPPTVGPRTTGNWWGENEEIPVKYLLPQSPRTGSFRARVAQPKPMVNSDAQAPHLTIRDILAKIPVCAGLSERKLKQLTRSGKFESVGSGQWLFHEGDEADKVYLILRGSIEILRSNNGAGETVLTTLRAGEFFGEMALFEHCARSASARALEPSKLFVFRGADFLPLVLR
jgi:hypothetical protein